MADLPYQSSKAGQSREKEIRDTLRSVGASAVGFMVDDDLDLVIEQFRLAGREITVPVSVGAYERAWLRRNKAGPRTYAKAHAKRARAQAEIAVWAILADWIKAQSAMIVCDLMSADEAFMSHIHGPSGRRLIETVGPQVLPPPEKKEE